MVRDESLWMNEFRSLDALADCHRIWLVDRQEGKVNAAKLRHLINRLGIPCYIYPESVKIKDISVSVTLRVEDFPALGGIVCRHSSVADSFRQFTGVPIDQYHSLAKGGY